MAAIYERLGHLFLEPLDEEYFLHMSKSNMFCVINSKNSDNLEDFFGSKIDQDTLKQIQSEYDRLFVGPHSLEAPPWRSIYVGDERIIFDENTLELKEYIAEDEIVFVLDSKVPEDHIGYLLEYLSIMYVRLADNESKKTMSRMVEFIEKFLLGWIEDLGDNIRESGSEFYTYLIDVTIDIIKEDIRELKRGINDKTT